MKLNSYNNYYLMQFSISLDSNTSIYESTLEIQVSNGISIENINNSKGIVITSITITMVM